MGLFGKLFDKKICAICGAEIGLFGNRKLEDGNCCKECAAKLSPWFSDRRESTVEEIKAQLAQREENKKAVAAFRTSRTLGMDTRVLIDDGAGLFMVTSADDLQAANPDVLQLSQVTACQLEIREHRREILKEVREKDGSTRKASYSPRRYHYSYSFHIEIRVDHPYLDEICFQLGFGDVDISPGFLSSEGVTSPPSLEMCRKNRDYAQREEAGREIRKALTEPRTEVQQQEQTSAAPAPAQAVLCPWCGSFAVPDESGCCPHCGGSMKAR